MVDHADAESTSSRQEQQQGLLDRALAEPGVTQVLEEYERAVRNGALTALPCRRTVISFASSANDIPQGLPYAGLG